MLLARIREQKRIQEEIRQKFGEKTLQEARDRLCASCYRYNCNLLPICMDGKDCPYSEKRKVKK